MAKKEVQIYMMSAANKVIEYYKNAQSPNPDAIFNTIVSKIPFSGDEKLAVIAAANEAIKCQEKKMNERETLQHVMSNMDGIMQGVSDSEK